MIRKLVIVAVVAAGALVPPAARAHAFLDHSDPAVGSTVPASPPTLALWFTEHIEPAFSGITVTDAAGQRVDLGNARMPPDQPAELEVGLRPHLPAGTYTVQWHVVTVDTHPTAGNFTFDVGR